MPPFGVRRSNGLTFFDLHQHYNPFRRIVKRFFPNRADFLQPCGAWPFAVQYGHIIRREEVGALEKLEAVIDGTVYRNEENGYSVIVGKSGRREVNIVGVLPALSQGEQVVFTGTWVEHPTYGKQFKAAGCDIRTPTTLLGIERYLGSGLIRGVGPTTAREIVQYFGAKTLEILSEHPERLQEVPRMGRKRWKMIAESFQEQQQERLSMVFLQSYGIPPGTSVKISRMYGDRTRDVVQNNPYQLCDDIEGIGFQTADRIGAALGIPEDSEFRIQTALRYVLREAANGSGHVYLPEQELLSATAQLLRVETGLCAAQLERIALRREVVIRQAEDSRERRVYLPAFDQAEQEVARRLCELMAGAAAIRDPQADRRISAFERRHGISFSQRQRDAITAGVEHGVIVITGGPGTGKTTIINCIISLLQSDDYQVKLCAPTGRAAKRMAEATGQQAKTIHRLLEYSGEEGAFTRNAENPIEADCVIVDEMSMVDLMLMRSLLRALEPGMRLILVGDADQLPSVGAGNVLGDILLSGAVPSVRLTDIYRQDDASQIVMNAHRINRGEMPVLNGKGTDFFFDRRESFPAASQTIVQLLTERLPKYLNIPDEDIVKTIQVLAPARKGECGVISLNAALQQALNPDRGQPSVRYGETVFRLGDKVMQTRNDYQLAWRQHTARGEETGTGVFNGDVGYVTAVDEDEHTLTVLFDDREAVYETQQMEDLELAYCLSVHKSQGSEFPVVVMPVVGGPPMLLSRNLFYTALTRAKSLVVLVGREATIRQMVENDRTQKRYTTLADHLTRMWRMISA